MPPRQVLTRDAWAQMAANPDPPLIALWADTREVHALLRSDDRVLLVSTAVEDGGYPALSPMRPFAAWFERVVQRPVGARRYSAAPISARGSIMDDGGRASRWPFVPVRPQARNRRSSPCPRSSTRSRWGRFTAAYEPAAHLRLGVRGQAVEQLELRLGYAHKGVLALMRGKSPRTAARFAARLVGETTVAHSLAFARATEAALACEVPPRAEALRRGHGAD